MGVIAGIGAAGLIGGTILNAGAASRRQREFQRIADTPGVDIGGVYKDTLGAAQTASPQAEALAAQQNTFNQSELDRLVNESIPGYRELQRKRIMNAEAQLGGQIPDDVAAQIARRGAATSLEGGYGGSGASRALVARDLGLTSLDLMGRGGQEFQSIIGSTPMAQRTTSGSLLNIDPKTGLALASGERSQKMDILLKKAGLKGATETYGNALSSVGGSLLSGGIGKMGGG